MSDMTIHMNPVADRLALIRKGSRSKPHVALVPVSQNPYGIPSVYVCFQPDRPYGPYGVGETIRQAMAAYAKVAEVEAQAVEFDLNRRAAERIVKQYQDWRL